MPIYDIDSIANFFRADQISDRILSKDEVLFREDDEVQSMYFVLDGEIRAETYLPCGKVIVFFRAFNGEALSEEALFITKYLFTAIASVPTKIRCISKTDFYGVFRKNPNFQDSLISCLAQRYSESMMVRELIAIKSAEERLEAWLQWQTRDGDRVVNLSGVMGNVAPQLGLSRESVYRAFAKLEKLGKLKRENGRVTLL